MSQKSSVSVSTTPSPLRVVFQYLPSKTKQVGNVSDTLCLWDIDVFVLLPYQSYLFVMVRIKVFLSQSAKLLTGRSQGFRAQDMLHDLQNDFVKY